MSSRALRRLEKQREAEQLAADPVVEDEPVIMAKKTQNLFALMNGDDDDDDDEESGKNATSEENDQEPSEPVKVVLTTKSQRKKKKKAQKKGKRANTPAEDEDDNDGTNTAEDDEFDRLLKEHGANNQQVIDTTANLDGDVDNELELNITHPNIDPSYRYFTPRKQVACAKLLSVDVKDLDPDNEFKKLFGKLSQEAIDDADSTTSTSIPPEQLQQIKKLARVIRGWGGRDRRSIPGTSRKLILTKVRDDWIPTQKKDISMEELSAKDLVEDRLASTEDWADVIKEEVVNEIKHGIRYYKFERGIDSKVANSQFYSSVVVTPNHENLMQLLPRFPYHVETILQVALILIRQGDKSNSNGLVERALFAFDRGFKQNFDISNGLTRLPFNYYLNREFYLAIFRYIEVLTKKGTFYTAFTYCKLLLAFSPADDPLGTRYFLDFYAILAGEYQWLIEFVESALVKTYAQWYTSSIAYTVPLAYLALGNKTKAEEELKRAFIKHPYVGYKLLETIGLASDIPVYDYSIFEVGAETEIQTEAYLLKAPHIWKETHQRNFLHDTLLKCIEGKVKFEVIGDCGVIPDNFLRFAILSGEGKVMARIPSEVWEQNQIFEYDVLPPKVGNVEVLSDFIDEKYLSTVFDEERLMEMVRNMSLQELVERGVQVDDTQDH